MASGDVKIISSSATPREFRKLFQQDFFEGTGFKLVLGGGGGGVLAFAFFWVGDLPFPLEEVFKDSEAMTGLCECVCVCVCLFVCVCVGIFSHSVSPDRQLTCY
jgi:hypothetical protein